MLFFGRIVYKGRESEAEAGERGEGLRRFFPHAGCAGEPRSAAGLHVRNRARCIREKARKKGACRGNNSLVFYEMLKGGGRVMTKRETESLRLRAEIFKALGHPTRLWIVEALAEGERCVADLADGVEGGLSAVSQHLAQPRQGGIVRDEWRGRQIYYSLTFPSVAEVCALPGGGAVRRPSCWARLR